MQTSVVKVVELQACAPKVEDVFFFFFPLLLFKMTSYFFTYAISYTLFISLLSRLDIQSIITKINFKRVQFSYLGTDCSFWDRLHNFLHKFTRIVFSVLKLNNLGKFWKIYGQLLNIMSSYGRYGKFLRRSHNY